MKKRSRLFLRAKSQPAPRPYPAERLPFADLFRRSRIAASVFGALCTEGGSRGREWVYVSWKTLASLTALQTRAKRNISRAIAALHDCGYIKYEPMRFLNKYGDLVQVSKIRLRTDQHAMLPLALFVKRLKKPSGIDQSQLTIAELNSMDRYALPVWAGLCELASEAKSLVVNVDKRAIATAAGIRDKSFETTGRALKVLVEAGWIKIRRRSGRRGNRIVSGCYELVIGTATRHIAPLSAMEECVSKKKKVKIPTSANNDIELLCNNTATTTATDRKGSTAADNGGRRLLFFTIRNKHLIPPTTQPEFMRPRILSKSLCASILDLSCLSELRPWIDNTIHILSDVEAECRARSSTIDEFSNSEHILFRSFKNHRQRWMHLRHWYNEWEVEARLSIRVLEFVQNAFADTGEERDTSELKVDEEGVISELKKYEFNRRARRVFFEGPDIVLTASQCHGQFSTFQQRLRRPSPMGPSTSGAISLPTYMPRYYGFVDGYCFDTLLNKYTTIPEGAFDSEGHTVNAVFDEASYHFDKYQRALKVLYKTSARALKQIVTQLDIQVTVSIFDERFGLEWFIREALYADDDVPPIFLVPSSAKCNLDDMALNLAPNAKVLTTYLRARREYPEAPVLGVVVTSRRGLWIIHDDASMRDTPGAIRYSSLCGSDGRRIVFERFSGFVGAAWQHYGWENQFS